MRNSGTVYVVVMTFLTAPQKKRELFTHRSVLAFFSLFTPHPRASFYTPTGGSGHLSLDERRRGGEGAFLEQEDLPDIFLHFFAF